MKRKILLILLITVILAASSALLVACTSSGGADNNTDENEQTEALDPSIPIGTSFTVKYKSMGETYGYISGETEQTIRYGETYTTAVTAVASLGYRFAYWSDGVTEATRQLEAPKASGDVVAYFELDTKELPILMINTVRNAEIKSKTEYIDGTISVFNVDDEYLLESLPMQIRGRGNYTWDSTFNRDEMYNKRPYRIKLSEQQKLAGVGKGKNRDWVLLADHCDQSLLRNNIVYTVAGAMPNILWQPSVQSVEVYLNGAYNGVYLLVEQVEVNKNKVNVSEDLTRTDIGFLVMYSNYTDLGTFESFSIEDQKFEIKNDFSDDPELAMEQWQYIQDYVYQCWEAVSIGDQDRVCELINIDSVLETYIVHEVFKNLDTGHDNFYMFKDVDGKLYFGPVWDFDQCAGNADVGVDDYTGIRGGYTQPWYAQLLEHSWFKKLLQEKWNELKPQYIDKISPTILGVAESGYNSYCRNFEKWQIFGYRINRETYVRQFTTYDEHYKYFAEFMDNRIKWLNNYWNDPAFTFDITDTFEGNGTLSSPFVISSADDFYYFTNCLLNGESFEGKYFLQSANIDMSSYQNYAGAGSSATFAGIYNGNGYTITANIRGNDGCVFPYVTGIVANVTTKGSVNNSGNAGGICRSVRAGGVVINCISYMNVSSGSNAGGITSSNQAGSVIANCFFGGQITNGNAMAPICVWYSDRYGVYICNYYIEGTPNTTERVELEREEIALSESHIKANLATILNSTRTDIFEYFYTDLDPDLLCRWTYDNEVKLVPNK